MRGIDADNQRFKKFDAYGLAKEDADRDVDREKNFGATASKIRVHDVLPNSEAIHERKIQSGRLGRSSCRVLP